MDRPPTPSIEDPVIEHSSHTNGKLMWFEFLLDNTLLENHLATENHDPSALELLEQFVDQAIRSLGTEETPEQKWKTLSLNLMALKVAAHLKWDLTVFKNRFPLYMVHKVLKDFVEHVSPVNFSLQSASSTICGLPDPILFALTTYNRWSIQTYIESALPSRQSKNPIQQPVGNTFNVAGVNEMVLKTVQRYSTLKECVSFLEFVVNLDRDVTIPDFHFFPNSPVFDQERPVNASTNKISRSELLCLICFDLGLFYFHEKRHQKAAEMFQKTHSLLNEIGKSEFCESLDRKTLQGYLEACTYFTDTGDSKPCVPSKTLSSRLLSCQKSEYQGVVDVLLEDNLKQQMPCYQREVVLQEALSSANLDSFVMVQICLCNAIRQSLENQPVSVTVWKGLHSTPVKYLEVASKFLEDIVTQINLPDRLKIVPFLWSVHSDRVLRPLLTQSLLKFLCRQENQDRLHEEDKKVEVLQKSLYSQTSDHENMGVYLGQLTLRLILSHDPAELDELLTKLHKISTAGKYASAYNKWHIDKSYAFIIDGLGNKRRQDMIMLLLVKTQHCVELKNLTTAKRLLQAAHNLMKECSSKLQRALVNEMLYVDLLNTQDSGYKHHEGKQEETIKRIQACAACVQNDREIKPRDAILQLCSLYIMNMQQWQLVKVIGDHDPVLKICANLVDIIQNLRDTAACRKPAAELWETVCGIFSYANQTKRDFLGVPVKRNPKETSGLKRMDLMSFITQLQSSVTLSVLLSCLCKLYNVVKDDPSNTLSHEYPAIWPRLVSSSHDVSIAAVSSALTRTLSHALQVYPDQPSWLKTKADIQLANNQPMAALRYYLMAAAATSQYFQKPVPKEVLSEEVLRKMSKCFTTLKCYTQVAVLCQFMESVDYQAAFKVLQERLCYDGGDALYQFFWDMTILEYLVYMHHKKGEEEKKQVALRALNHPELNTCNPAHILQAASQRRKARFLLALARQYL